MNYKTSQLTLDFLHWFNTLSLSPHIVSKEETCEFISPDIHFYLNGEILAIGLEDY